MQYRNSEETHSFVKKYFFGRQCIAERRSIISYSNVICTLLGPRNDHGGLKILKAWAMPSPFRCSEILGFFRSPLEINAPSKVTSSPRINRVEILPREMKKREDHTVKNYNSAQFSSLSWTWNAAAASLPSPFLRSLVRVPQGKGEGPSTKIGYLSFIEFPFEVFVKGDSHYDRSSRKVMGYLLWQSKRVNLPIQVKSAARSIKIINIVKITLK